MEENTFHTRLAEIIGEEPPFAWASKIGIPSSTFHRIWHKGHNPKAKYLQMIHEKTGVSVDWLLTGRGKKYRLESDEPIEATKKKVSETSAESISYDVPGELSAAEAQLIFFFRKLKKNQREKMPSLMSFLASDEREELDLEVEKFQKELEKEEAG